jgi:hypothetical protein
MSSDNFATLFFGEHLADPFVIFEKLKTQNIETS